MWVAFYHAQRQLVEWRSYFAATVAGDSAPPTSANPDLAPLLADPGTWRALSQEEREAVCDTTVPVLDALMDLLEDGALECVGGWEGGDAVGTEVIVWAGMMPTGHADEAVRARGCCCQI